MKIHQLNLFKFNPSFGYSSPLKTLYLKGELPVKYGFYGDRLNTKNVKVKDFNGNKYIKGILNTITQLIRGA